MNAMKLLKTIGWLSLVLLPYVVTGQNVCPDPCFCENLSVRCFKLPVNGLQRISADTTRLCVQSFRRLV